LGEPLRVILLVVGGSAVSSLRPLLTILVLAAVGVLLYMKINETEPVVPAGVGDWTAGPLDIGGGAAVADAGASTAPPNYAADAAPAFTPSTIAPSTTGSSASAPPAADVAPSWSPGPTAASEPSPSAVKASPSPSDSSPVARTAEPKIELPAMPPLPGASSEDKTAATPAPTDAAPAFSPNTTPAVTKNPTAIDTAPPAIAKSGATPADSITPTATAPEAATPPAQASLYPLVRVAVQAELERGELSQALLRLSDWYGDPSLTPAERQEVDTLLSQLAGSVIWEGAPAHRLEKAYIVAAGETLQDIGEKYDVPWQLLAKINGIADPGALQPGQELKVLRGKFSALVDLSERTMTLMLDRRYAGKFAIELDPTTAIEEGQWKVDQKALTPAGGGVYGQAMSASEDRSLILANPASPGAQAAVLRGPGSSDPASPQPAGRVIRLKSGDVNEVYDILSVGSRVTIRR
jgi:LysM repeat protein